MCDSTRSIGESPSRSSNPSEDAAFDNAFDQYARSTNVVVSSELTTADHACACRNWW